MQNTESIELFQNMSAGTSVCPKNAKIELNIKDKLRLLALTSQKN